MKRGDRAGMEGEGAPAEKIGLFRDGGSADMAVRRLEDPDIRVRGEAFSYLMDEKDAYGHLAEALGSPDANVRGSAALILANRGEVRAIDLIAKMVSDPEPAVRSCALGALGYLRASGQIAKIHACIRDSEPQVAKSALWAAILMGMVPESLPKGGDAEMRRLVKKASESLAPA